MPSKKRTVDTNRKAKGAKQEDDKVKVVKKKKKSTKPTFYINLTNCKYDVIRKVIKGKGWVECDDDDEVDWTIFWTDTSVAPQRAMYLAKYQKINHFPGMLIIARKAQMAITLNRLRAVFPEQYSFFPKTWVLPQDMKEFRKNFSEKTGKSKSTFIIKPDAACQGKGIFLTRSLDLVNKLEAGVKYVAQKYSAKPFLIDGYKFDLRIYVLVLSCDPLRIFLYDDGLVRLCTKKYVAPTTKNFSKTRMHLTNYAINKSSNKFEKNQSADNTGVGSKRTIKWFREHLASLGHDDVKMWDDVTDVVNKTIISAQPHLAHMYHSCFMDPDNDGFSCFEILGLDILFTEKLKPVLIEVNHSPSFTCDSPLDLEIKHGLIKETLKLVNASRYDKSRYKKRVAAQAQSRLYGGGNKAQLRKINKQQKNKMSIRAAHEKKVMRNFKRIFPPVLPEPILSEDSAVTEEKVSANEGNGNLRDTEPSPSSKSDEREEESKMTVVSQDGDDEQKVGDSADRHSASYYEALYQTRLDFHFENVNNYRRFFVAANDLFETVAVGPSGLRKSATWQDRSMSRGQRSWTAAVAARAEGIREYVGEDGDNGGDGYTSLDIRRQIRHSRFLEQKKSSKSFAVVTLNSEKDARAIPMRSWSQQSPNVRQPMLPKPPSKPKSKQSIMGKPATVERPAPLSVEDYFRQARLLGETSKTVSLPPSPTKNTGANMISGRNRAQLVHDKRTEFIRPKTSASIECIRMEKMKQDEMISGKKVQLNEHDIDPGSLFGSFVNYRYRERERVAREEELKATKEKEIAAMVKRKKKIKKAKSSSGFGRKARSTKLRKTTLNASTTLGIRRGGLVGGARKKSMLM